MRQHNQRVLPRAPRMHCASAGNYTGLLVLQQNLNLVRGGFLRGFCVACDHCGPLLTTLSGRFLP